MARPIVGGGPKKVLYALRTLQRVGIGRATKALRSKNACKACGLGMGGQHGGMTNERDEFPSVCNKSIQAQSTDIQPAIPVEILTHPLADLRELDGHELEHLGRLGTPIYKKRGADRFEPVGWERAYEQIARRFAVVSPQRTFFYSSGRSSNEAGFVLQLLARAYGTNNVNNCSYYCHQATSEGLKSTIGVGTATVELEDLERCDLVFLLGANPSSNHPRLMHKLKACRERGGDVIVINPAREAGLVRFALPKSAASMLKGGDWIASEYLQPRIGSDLAVFKGIAKALLAADAIDREFIHAHATGFDEFQQDTELTEWSDIERRSGLRRADLERVAARYGRAKHVVFAWGMGMTHHLHGVSNVEYIANLALLRGQVGKLGAGLLPLRGHSNVQGIGTIGVKPVLAAEVFEKMQQAFGIELPRGPGFDTLAGLNAAHRGEVDVALMMGGNLFEATPNTAWAAEAMDRIGSKVFLTTTLNRGHLQGIDSGETWILPVTARDEEWQPTTQESMFNYVRLSDGGIHRLDDVKPEVTILTEIAKRLLPDSRINFAEFREHKTIREAIARIVPGLEDLAHIDVAKREFHVRGRILHAPEFKTTDGKARFVTRAVPPAAESLLLTTVRSEGQFNTIVYEYQDTYRGMEHRWSAMLHPDDLAAHGLADGDIATLESVHGRMEDVTMRAFDIARGSVMAYYPEANVLIGTATDPRSKTPAFKSTPVRIVPALARR